MRCCLRRLSAGPPIPARASTPSPEPSCSGARGTPRKPAPEAGGGHQEAEQVQAIEAAFGRGDELLTPGTWLRHVVRRLIAERALEDGWGDPVPWLRESAAFFAFRGIEPLARACRSLLRRAGAPLPRARSRTQDSVPDALRAKAVTRREADVLALLAEGLANKEIGERLYLSPRTVEKHVERLLAKTETANRTQLTALAVRLLE